MIPEPKLKDLYQEVILDHNHRPRNFKEIEKPTHYSHGNNPLCGDDYHLYLVVDGAGVIQDVGFKGSGCAISKSSASIMTTLVKGKQIQDVIALKENFVELLVAKDAPADSLKAKVGKLTLFEGVREFPVRVKCASLIWHTLADALRGTPSHSEI